LDKLLGYCAESAIEESTWIQAALYICFLFEKWTCCHGIEFRSFCSQRIGITKL